LIIENLKLIFMFNKKIIIAFSLCLLAVLTMGAGCSVSLKNNDTSGTDGGFWVSLDKGVVWQQASFVPTPNGVGSMNSFDDTSLVLDPGDTSAVYFGSSANGLYYTYGLNKGWNQADTLKETKINAVAVSPDDKCIVFAAAGNRLYRSNDCNRTWTQIFFDNDTTTQIKAIAIDFYDAHRVYFGNSRGEISESVDRGDHWITVLRSGSGVNQIVLSPFDSRKVFVTTVGEGLYRSTDAGDTWTPLKDKMTEFKNSFNIVSLVAAPSSDGLFFAATAYGLLKTADAGDTWTRINLITPEAQASINALAIDPKDPKAIYYVTNTTFYSSADGGISWRTKKLPSTRAGVQLLIKPDQTSAIFMGVRKVAK
jgi:photosystem II stability/assembly factor-like uncharacterized protein